MFKRILKWAVIVVAGAYVLLVIYRAFVLQGEENTERQVQRIHATKLSLDDVMGTNLPPVPSNPDSSISGFDANRNGIRDDVELAIFKEYPNSARTRAVLLQYALALQMEVVQPKINEEIATALAEEESRADSCVADTLVPRRTPESSRSYSDIEKIDSYIQSLESKEFNTLARKEANTNFSKNVGSFELQSGCDVDLSALPN